MIQIARDTKRSIKSIEKKKALEKVKRSKKK